MVEQAMDLRASAAVLRAGWRLLAKVAAVGLMLGLTYTISVPGRLASTTLVLLPAPLTEVEIPTQIRIVLSSPVLEQAGKRVKPTMTMSQVRDNLVVDAPTVQLVEITAYSRRAADAKALSQAVTESYLTALRESARAVTSLSLTDLRSRQDALDRQLKALQTEIESTAARQKTEEATSFSGRRDAQLLAQLTAEQANISLQLDKVKDSLATFETLSGAAGAAATVIQPASPAVGSGLVQRLLTWGLIGVAAGYVAGAAALLVRTRRDPRVRSRDGLADAVGNSVIADVRSRPQQSVGEWLAMFESYEVGPVEEWAFRRILRAFVPDYRGPGLRGEHRFTGRLEHPRSLTVLSVEGDARGLAVGPQLAVFTASLGIVTRVVASAGQDSSAALWAACASDRNIRPGLILSAPFGTHSTASRANGGPDEGTPHGVAERLAVSSGSPGRDVTQRIAALLGKKSDLEAAAPAAADTHAASVGGTADDHGEAAEPEGAAKPGPASVAPDDPDRDVDFTIVLAVMNRREPSMESIPETAFTLLAISPGTAGPDDLARLAVATDDAGRQIDGIVVADPDVSDRTTGRHTLEKRGREEPLPMRLTGMSPVAPVAVAGTDRGNRS